jgi:hypothetical protein
MPTKPPTIQTRRIAWAAHRGVPGPWRVDFKSLNRHDRRAALVCLRSESKYYASCNRVARGGKQ